MEISCDSALHEPSHRSHQTRHDAVAAIMAIIMNDKRGPASPLDVEQKAKILCLARVYLYGRPRRKKKTVLAEQLDDYLLLFVCLCEFGTLFFARA